MLIDTSPTDISGFMNSSSFRLPSPVRSIVVGRGVWNGHNTNAAGGSGLEDLPRQSPLEESFLNTVATVQNNYHLLGEYEDAAIKEKRRGAGRMMSLIRK